MMMVKSEREFTDRNDKTYTLELRGRLEKNGCFADLFCLVEFDKNGLPVDVDIAAGKCKLNGVAMNKENVENLKNTLEMVSYNMPFHIIEEMVKECLFGD